MRPTKAPGGNPGEALMMEPMELPKRPLDLLSLDLPQGDPWGYALAQALLKAPWAWRALRPTPGLLDLVRLDLEALFAELHRLREQNPLDRGWF